MPQRSAPQREFRTLLPAVLLGLALTYYVGLIWSISNRANSVDFVQFFVSARAVLDGESLYAPLLMSDIGMVPPEGRDPKEALHPNLNPPLLAVLLAPISTFGIPAAYAIWTGVSLGCGLLACAWISRAVRPAGATDAALVWFWLAVLVYYPTHSALMLGQVTFVLMALVTGAWMAARGRHDRTAGILLGIALNLKLFTGLLIVYFAWQRRWRAAAWAVASTVAVALVPLPWVGPSAYVEYLELLPSVDWFSSNWNASFASFFTRVLGGSENVPFMNLPAVANGLTMMCSVVAVAWLAWLTRPGSRAGRTDTFDLGFGLTMVLMLLVSPLGWMYYFPLLALPGHLVWSAAGERRLFRLRAGLAVAWGLSTVPLSMVRSADANIPSRWLTLDSVYFYALTILMCLVAVAFRGGDSAASAPSVVTAASAAAADV